MNLQNNKLKEIPSNLAQILPKLEILNLNNNQLEDLYSVVDILSTFPNLKSLFINLALEEEVTYIMKMLPDLQYLNGQEVDREDFAGNDMESQQPDQLSLPQINSTGGDHNNYASVEEGQHQMGVVQTEEASIHPTINQQMDQSYKQEQRPAPETPDSDQDSEDSDNQPEINEHLRMPKAQVLLEDQPTQFHQVVQEQIQYQPQVVMDYADDAQNTSELFVNMSRISQRASMKR